MLEAIGIGIVVLIWVVSSLIKGFKWVLRQTGAVQPPPPPVAPPRSQTPPLGTGQFSPQPPPRPQPPSPTRTRQAPPRSVQPSAGEPAVPEETTRRDFERQEQELFFAEPAALDTPLSSASSQPSAQTNGLFSGTDDLVLAIIRQEVLGTPLSRRTSPPARTLLPPQ